MLVNRDTGKPRICHDFQKKSPKSNSILAISTSAILLVPYEDHHVPTYHSWMQDEEIQEATASEPLTLPAEYAMQRSWRTDTDKLTFIACLPAQGPASGSKPPSIISQREDAAARMLGDINLFLTLADEDPEGCVGELELMIAPKDARRRGYGRAALLAFLMYLQEHLDAVLEEYGARPARDPGGADAVGEKRSGKMRLLQLRVKIGSKNEKSINLFTSVGFMKVGEGENYFGEVELVFEGFLGPGRMEALFEKWGVRDYVELAYHRIE